MTEFSIEELLGDAIVRHTGDMTCPSRALRVMVVMLWTFTLCRTSILGTILAADVKEVTGASEMEMIEDLFKPSLHSPGF